jgi:acetyl-CoA synthetase
MGKPWGDINAAICDDDGNEVPVRKAGNLCLRLGWDSMFAMYLNNKEVYENKFKNGYYFSGDLAYKDEKGYFYFMSRNDDIINTAGHLISPFEIESALLEMDEIAESAVIGVPDELLWEKIIAFVNLKKQFIWNEDIELKIRIYLSNKLSTIATPKEIIPLDVIPKNKSGKILRRVLKANYLGEDAGDVSTMDDQI